MNPERSLHKLINLSALMIALSMLVSGCGSVPMASDRTAGSSSSVEDVLQQGMEDADASEKKAISTPESYGKDESAATGDNTADDQYSFDRQSGISDGAPDPEEVNIEELLSSTEGIDIDLTALSSTMVYSEVYDMMANPEAYVGKTVRMSGTVSSFYDESIDKYYFACIIKDATACCAQGIEFELTSDYVCPDDYPADDDLITVTGTFDTYMEGESMYVTLRNAKKG